MRKGREVGEEDEKNKRYKITKRQTDTKWPKTQAMVMKGRGGGTDGGAKGMMEEWRLLVHPHTLATHITAAGLTA